MKLIVDFFDLKITFFYSLVLMLFNAENISVVYQVLCGLIYLGYNIHRWVIMYQEQKAKKDQSKNSKQ